jgi:hypothetical protein
MVGSMLSTTVTTCVAVAVLPDPSVTVQVTVVAPNGKLAGASFVVEATLQLSPVVGVPRVTFARAVVHTPASTLTLTAAGAVMVGSMLSTTVIVAVTLCVLFEPSVAVNVTVFEPRSSQSNEVLSRDNVNVQLSLLPLSTSAVEIVTDPEALRFTVISFAIATGGVLSVISTITVELTEQPFASVTVSVYDPSPTPF